MAPVKRNALLRITVHLPIGASVARRLPALLAAEIEEEPNGEDNEYKYERRSACVVVCVPPRFLLCRSGHVRAVGVGRAVASAIEIDGGLEIIPHSTGDANAPVDELGKIDIHKPEHHIVRDDRDIKANHMRCLKDLHNRSETRTTPKQRTASTHLDITQSPRLLPCSCVGAVDDPSLRFRTLHTRGTPPLKLLDQSLLADIVADYVLVARKEQHLELLRQLGH
jgi:hypothetical protein